ncbi:MAG: NeuD/PglB/VioB family sugar acetyltransferase [Legionellales bacterium]|nr:NeuD/PglB/VioB family sugar acetyltransferase [Legionellales bacterium]
MNKIKIPQLGVNDEYAKIVKWLVKDGDKVSVNQEICLIETMKTAISVESPYDGYIQILAKTEEELPFHSTIAVIFDSQDEKYVETETKSNNIKDDLDTPPDNIEYTKAALEYAKSNNIDLEQFKFKKGIIRKKDIIDYLNKENADTINSKQDFNSDPIKPEICTMKHISVAIYGTQLGSEVIYDHIMASNQYEINFFIDDFVKEKDSKFLDVPVIAGNDIANYKNKIDAVACFIANNSFRLKIFEMCNNLGLDLLSLISPNINIRSSAKVGRGVFLKDGAVVGSYCKIGDCVIIDSNVTVSHHTHINRGAFLAPGCVIGGGVTIGEQAIVGLGASVVSKITIGKKAIISAGSVVNNDIPDYSIVQGNPAKIIGKSMT